MYQPVAENIRSLGFQYFDHEGRPLGPGTPGTSSDDIGGDDSELLTRARIRSLRINLTGMLPGASDRRIPGVRSRAEETGPLALSSLLAPENLGRGGMTDQDDKATP